MKLSKDTVEVFWVLSKKFKYQKIKNKMTATNKLTYGEEVWEYVYFKADGLLSQEDHEHLLWHAIDMEKKQRDKMNLKGEDYEGQIERKDKTCLGHFAGRRFDATVETNRGKSRLSVLMIEPVRWWDN